MSINGLWQKEPCAECGEEGYASRSEPRDPEAGPYICEACEMYARGYEDGKKHAESTTIKCDVNGMKLSNMLGLEWHKHLCDDDLYNHLLEYQAAQRYGDVVQQRKCLGNVLVDVRKICSSLHDHGNNLNKFVMDLLFDNTQE
jgi:hypothetical protein